MTTRAQRHLAREFQAYERDPIPGVSIGLKGDSLFLWTLMLQGPLVRFSKADYLEQNCGFLITIPINHRSSSLSLTSFIPISTPTAPSVFLFCILLDQTHINMRRQLSVGCQFIPSLASFFQLSPSSPTPTARALQTSTLQSCIQMITPCTKSAS